MKMGRWCEAPDSADQWARQLLRIHASAYIGRARMCAQSYGAARRTRQNHPQ